MHQAYRGSDAADRAGRTRGSYSLTRNWLRLLVDPGMQRVEKPKHGLRAHLSHRSDLDTSGTGAIAVRLVAEHTHELGENTGAISVASESNGLEQHVRQQYRGGIEVFDGRTVETRSSTQGSEREPATNATNCQVVEAGSTCTHERHRLCLLWHCIAASWPTARTNRCPTTSSPVSWS